MASANAEGTAAPHKRTTDVRGNITSRRARSTIAGRLCNAKEPMTLFGPVGLSGQRRTGSNAAPINPASGPSSARRSGGGPGRAAVSAV
ncbi:hypothetical protein GCM10023205_18260 [Yinghuangia aomiensis]|uniref:Uncharacterized protein n=1 Tax=Yinghuangia aomiensis TaxID=676205 RepID=A0ABP9H084_9ACTN